MTRKLTWHPAKFAIHSPAGPREVRGLKDSTGRFGLHTDPFLSRGTALTHMETGKRITGLFPDLGSAAHFAELIEPMANWGGTPEGPNLGSMVARARERALNGEVP